MAAWSSVTYSIKNSDSGVQPDLRAHALLVIFPWKHCVQTGNFQLKGDM